MGVVLVSAGHRGVECSRVKAMTARAASSSRRWAGDVDAQLEDGVLVVEWPQLCAASKSCVAAKGNGPVLDAELLLAPTRFLGADCRWRPAGACSAQELHDLGMGPQRGCEVGFLPGSEKEAFRRGRMGSGHVHARKSLRKGSSLARNRSVGPSKMSLPLWRTRNVVSGWKSPRGSGTMALASGSKRWVTMVNAS